MTWTPILDVLADLGMATTDSLWLPLLAWTALALPIWKLLEHTDRLHPYAEYRLSQILLLALPVGIAAAGLIDLLPETAAPVAVPIALSQPTILLETTDATPSSAPTWHWMHAVGLLTILALSVGIYRLSQLVLDTAAAVRLRRTLNETTDETLRKQVTRLTHRLGIRRSVRVCVTPEATVPATLGGLRPSILVPPGLADARDILRPTLVHECVHVRRWDDLAHVVERFVAAVFAIHPVAESLRQWIVGTRERACDAAVLDDGPISRASYARLLISFADGSPSDRLGALPLSESPSSLKDRLFAMRAPMSTLLSSRRALSAAVVVLGLGLTIGVVACTDAVGPTSTHPDGPSELEPPFADSSVHRGVDERPQLRGGMEALQASVNYPDEAKKAGVEGRVIVQFVVGPDGAVHEPTVLQSVNEWLDKEAIEAVKAQEFEPGRNNGDPVPVKMSLPVTFRLSETTEVGPEPPKPQQTSRDTYMVVEDRPQLVGGMKALQKAMQYPEVAKDDGIEGRVIVQFVVTPDGSVKNPEVMKGVHKLLDRAAVEAVQRQQFEPGRQDGKPVPVEMSLPVTFQLSESPATSLPSQSQSHR